MFKEFNVRNSDTIWKAKVMGGTGVSIPLWYSILDGLHASGYELVDFYPPDCEQVCSDSRWQVGSIVFFDANSAYLFGTELERRRSYEKELPYYSLSRFATR